MSFNDGDQSFVRAVCQVLDAEADNLEAGTRSRLNRIRQDALQTIARDPQARRNRGLGWLAGATAAAAFAAMLYFTAVPATLEMASETHLEAFSLIPLEESVEFFEDIEFYAWMAETDNGQV